MITFHRSLRSTILYFFLGGLVTAPINKLAASGASGKREGVVTRAYNSLSEFMTRPFVADKKYPQHGKQRKQMLGRFVGSAAFFALTTWSANYVKRLIVEDDRVREELEKIAAQNQFGGFGIPGMEGDPELAQLMALLQNMPQQPGPAASGPTDQLQESKTPENPEASEREQQLAEYADKTADQADKPEKNQDDSEGKEDLEDEQGSGEEPKLEALSPLKRRMLKTALWVLRFAQLYMGYSMYDNIRRAWMSPKSLVYKSDDNAKDIMVLQPNDPGVAHDIAEQHADLHRALQRVRSRMHADSKHQVQEHEEDAKKRAALQVQAAEALAVTDEQKRQFKNKRQELVKNWETQFTEERERDYRQTRRQREYDQYVRELKKVGFDIEGEDSRLQLDENEAIADTVAKYVKTGAQKDLTKVRSVRGENLFDKIGIGGLAGDWATRARLWWNDSLNTTRLRDQRLAHEDDE